MLVHVHPVHPLDSPDIFSQPIRQLGHHVVEFPFIQIFRPPGPLSHRWCLKPFCISQSDLIIPRAPPGCPPPWYPASSPRQLQRPLYRGSIQPQVTPVVSPKRQWNLVPLQVSMVQTICKGSYLHPGWIFTSLLPGCWSASVPLFWAEISTGYVTQDHQQAVISTHFTKC